MLSCKPTVPSEYIQPDDMEDLLYDMHIALSMADNENDYEKRDFNRVLYFATVLKNHGVTKAQFDSSLIYYYIRADRFSPIYKRVAQRLSDEALELGASEGEVVRYANITNSEDTTDIWTGDLLMMLIPYAPYNRYDFTQKSDSSFRKGDSFLFMVNSDFIIQSGSRDAKAVIAVRYDNDTVVCKTTGISTSGVCQLQVPELKGRKAKEISGFIYLTPEKEETTNLKLLAIKNIRLIKFRKKELPKDSVATDKKQPIDTLKTRTL